MAAKNSVKRLWQIFKRKNNKTKKYNNFFKNKLLDPKTLQFEIKKAGKHLMDKNGNLDQCALDQDRSRFYVSLVLSMVTNFRFSINQVNHSLNK